MLQGIQFFLELWAEINHRASLRARAESVPLLPSPNSTEDEPPEGTIFEELVRHYRDLAGRAEELIVSSVTGEVESGLKPHLQGGSTYVTTARLEMRYTNRDTVGIPPPPPTRTRRTI